ncbi:hypothetical protein PO124_30815 [Bacillus licheniformis]|nr:hypothetical protein [Bacillus licheniformis]
MKGDEAIVRGKRRSAKTAKWNIFCRRLFYNRRAVKRGANRN